MAKQSQSLISIEAIYSRMHAKFLLNIAKEVLQDTFWFYKPGSMGLEIKWIYLSEIKEIVDGINVAQATAKEVDWMKKLIGCLTEAIEQYNDDEIKSHCWNSVLQESRRA